jgi:hypothetical protein
MPRLHKDAEEREITARPKGIAQELGDAHRHESGLSVDPEDLGRQFLSEAMEQGNFESQRGGGADDLGVTAAASSDNALLGPNFEGDRSIWENTISLTLQNGGTDEAQEELAPPSSSDEDEDEDELDGLRTLDNTRLDLTEDVLQEASLLDHETETLGETESPELRTDDGHSHAKKRGGHARKTPRAPSRTR